MTWEVIGTDHLKARCVCDKGQDYCPLHQVPTIVYQDRESESGANS